MERQIGMLRKIPVWLRVLLMCGIGLGGLELWLDQSRQCDDITIQKLAQCTFSRGPEMAQASFFRELAMSRYASDRMRKDMLERLVVFNDMLLDPRVTIFWQERKNEDDLRGRESTFVSPNRDKLSLVFILSNQIHLTSEDLAGASHESLYHGTEEYKRFTSGKPFWFELPTEEAQKADAKEEIEAWWFGYYWRKVAELELRSKLSSDNQIELSRFGADRGAVVYMLEQSGFTPQDSITQYIFDNITRFIYTRNDTDPIWSPLLRFATTDEQKKEIEDIRKRWSGYPLQGTREQEIIKMLISRGLLHPSFLPNLPAQINHARPSIQFSFSMN